MLFNSFIFLYLFLPIVYVGFWQLKTKQQRYLWLTCASYIFYGYWNWKFSFLMAFSTMVSFAAGLGFRRWQDERSRHLCLVVPVTVDLLLLAFFKYANFALGSLQALLQKAHVSAALPHYSILLPIGISFYTFHTISYIVDSYRRDITPTDDFWEFACYVSLFSQLVAGPIVRFRQVETDLERLDGLQQESSVNTGWSFFTIGLIKKVLIADTLAALINPAFEGAASLSTASAWLCVLGYAYQLYFDFSGYSDMAVGLGRLFGIRLPQNFDSPYKAESLGDFWRRWHMSLSSCLRDYLYIPLGGNRGPSWFIVRNLLITMVLGGLWHGAHWTFVFWGAYHGTLLIIMRLLNGPWDRLPRILRRVLTFGAVLVGWVFFRSPTMATAFGLLRIMSWPHPGLAVTGAPTLLALLGLAAIIAHTGPNTFQMRHEWSAGMASAFALLFAVCLFTMYGAHASPFLYFQF